MPKIAF